MWNFIFFNAVIPFNSSWQTSLSYRNQSIDLLSKSMGWFLYDKDVLHEGLRSMFPSQKTHCVNYARIWIFSDPCFPVWGRKHRFYVSDETRVLACFTQWTVHWFAEQITWVVPYNGNVRLNRLENHLYK